MSLHVIWTLVQIHIYANKIRCTNACDVRQLSNPVIFKIYKDLDQMQQKAGKIKVQEDEGNGEKHLRHTQLLKKKKKTAITTATTKKHLYHFFNKQMGKL